MCVMRCWQCATFPIFSMSHPFVTIYSLPNLLQADIALGGLLNGSLAAMRAKTHAIKTQLNAASLTIKVCRFSCSCVCQNI